ncbi:MAG: hypothetical protein ALECFALPRED_004548, partial [Alectoria fallacina]
MAFSRFNKKPSSTVSSSSSQPLPLLITNLTLRFLQLIFAVAVLGLYGTELSNARKNHTGDYSKWVYAEVVGVLSAVTCLVYVLPKVKSWWAFGWDLILFILWVAVFGVFGKIYIHAKPVDGGVKRMKNAVWVDLVNMLLWLVTAVVGVVAFFMMSVARISAAQDACVYRSGAMLVESVVVVKHTIHIITSIPHNTTFKVNTGLTITVDNAPTSLDLLTTYFSRSTAIETMNGRNTHAASRYGTGNFTLIIVASELSPKRRRQAGAFMSYTGRATSSCTQASILTLANNQLWITYSNGTVAQFSATSGDTYDYFAPSTTPGDITTTFSLSSTGTLLWTSPEFFNGNALFCLLPSGVIVAVFQQGAQPISCVFMDLTIAELNSCVAASSAVTAVLGGPGPSG